jgi:hypothetical protein
MVRSLTNDRSKMAAIGDVSPKTTTLLLIIRRDVHLARRSVIDVWNQPSHATDLAAARRGGNDRPGPSISRLTIAGSLGVDRADLLVWSSWKLKLRTRLGP